MEPIYVPMIHDLSSEYNLILLSNAGFDNTFLILEQQLTQVPVFTPGRENPGNGVDATTSIGPAVSDLLVLHITPTSVSIGDVFPPQPADLIVRYGRATVRIHWDPSSKDRPTGTVEATGPEPDVREALRAISLVGTEVRRDRAILHAGRKYVRQGKSPTEAFTIAWKQFWSRENKVFNR